MPKKGYKQTRAQRRKISEKKKLWWIQTREAIRHYKPPRKKFELPPSPASTPVPPSASQISKPEFQRWGLYSYNPDGRYYYKREHADSHNQLRALIRRLDLEPPYWTYVKSAHSEADLFLPIRIPEEAVKTLGQRFSKYIMKKKEEKPDADD